jgi:hypothetical protein
MRKFLTISALLLANSLFGQLAPGKYSYKNEDARITFTISEDGQLIKDCVIKGTNDISLVSLRSYRNAGEGEFVKNVVDPTKKSIYVGYYAVSGPFPSYEIRVQDNADMISISIGVRLKSTKLIRE